MNATSPVAYKTAALPTELHRRKTLCIVAGLCGGKMSRVSRANAVSVELTHPLVVSADLTRQVLVSLQIVWPSWTASVHAGYARRQDGSGRSGQVSCRCRRASGLLPIPPSPATRSAGRGNPPGAILAGRPGPTQLIPGGRWLRHDLPLFLLLMQVRGLRLASGGSR